jgi:hypothetical protein
MMTGLETRNGLLGQGLQIRVSQMAYTLLWELLYSLYWDIL